MVEVFTFSSVLFEANAEGSWVFAALPPEDADDILDMMPRRPGFGSVRVEVTLGSTTWSTSLFPSKADRTYLLPIKKAVRQQEQVDVGDSVQVSVEVMPNDQSS